jgi:hypothetical protein
MTSGDPILVLRSLLAKALPQAECLNLPAWRWRRFWPRF